MRIHHLSCGTMCPPFRRWLQGDGGRLERARIPCHCLLIETAAHGLVLVDTGLGLLDVRNPVERLGPTRYLLNPQLDERATAIRQIEALGFEVKDVQHIVLTHLDFDHAGGLTDFPDARVHLLADERKAGTEPPTRAEARRYRELQWDHDPLWRTYQPGGEKWRDFEIVRQLEDLPPEILLLPMPGHTRGHAAVAVDTGDGWLVHAGDAYFYRGEMEREYRCTSGYKVFQKLVAVDDALRRANLERLRELRYGYDDIQVFSAHDPDELAALRG